MNLVCLETTLMMRKSKAKKDIYLKSGSISVKALRYPAEENANLQQFLLDILPLINVPTPNEDKHMFYCIRNSGTQDSTFFHNHQGIEMGTW